MESESSFSPDAFGSFGDFLRYLRQRARKNLRELAIELGYTEGHLSRMERGQRNPPERTMLLARFVPALQIEGNQDLCAHLLELAELNSTDPGLTQMAVPPTHGAPYPLESPEGTMRVDSPFYITRRPDGIAMEEIQRQGVTFTIKGPRQVGKSSLLMRIQHAAEQRGKQVVYLNFQLFDSADLVDDDQFFRRFCSFLSTELEIEDRVEEYWRQPQSNIQRCSWYVERHLLKELNSPLLLAMDEVDHLFESSFRSGFFGMLRTWHNDRSIKRIWRQLDLALVTSTEPNQLIDNPHQSPFNVGEPLDLPDFNLAQVADQNKRHGTPLGDAQEEELFELTSGHPYLVRRGLYVIANGRYSPPEFFAAATADDGPFSTHLRHLWTRLLRRQELVPALLQVIHAGTAQDKRALVRLESAGLIRRQGGRFHPRCALYAKFFHERIGST